MNNRKYIMIQSDEKDKELYKWGSARRGFKAVSHWFRALAFKDLSRLRKEERDERA